MKALLDFLSKYNHWILFGILEGLSLMMLFQFNHYQNSVWNTTANIVVGQVDEWEQEALKFINMGKANQELTRRNLVLEYNMNEMSRKLAELTHDSSYTELRQQERLEGINLIPARVVTNSVRKHDNFMTINKGEADGVKPEMGVVCGTGVVGIVYMTSSHYSIVLPLLNGRSRVSCRLRGSNYFGNLRWDGRHPLYVLLDDIPRHAHCKVGDIVETSGFSSVFMPGIFVGKVARVENSEDGLSYQLRVQLGTDFANIQNVCVVNQQFQAEQRNLELKLDSLNSAR